VQGPCKSGHLPFASELLTLSPFHVASVCLQLGDELNLYEGQGSVLFDSYEKVGPYDVDLYLIKVEGMLEAELRVRAAHPSCKKPATRRSISIWTLWMWPTPPTSMGCWAKPTGRKGKRTTVCTVKCCAVLYCIVLYCTIMELVAPGRLLRAICVHLSFCLRSFIFLQQ